MVVASIVLKKIKKRGEHLKKKLQIRIPASQSPNFKIYFSVMEFS